MENLDWSETSASDVDQRIAVVVSLPFGFPRDEPQRFADTIHRIALDTLTADLREQLEVTPYQIGPSAEWFPTFLLTIQHVGLASLDVAANLIELANAGFQVAKRIRRWKDEHEEHTEIPPGIVPKPPVVSAPIVVGKCLEHFAEYHGELGEISIDLHTRTTNEYGTAEHPSGYEMYTVSIHFRNRTTIYIVNGFCEAADHFAVENGTVETLSLPNWLERPYFPQESANAVPQICLE